MNRWLTWRARLAHFLDPSGECLCHVCADARKGDRIVAIMGARKLPPPAPRPRPDDWEDDCD